MSLNRFTSFVAYSGGDYVSEQLRQPDRYFALHPCPIALRIDFKGPRFSVTFKGQQLFEVNDSTFTEAGKVGLWTKADSVTLFDEVTYGETE